MIQDNPVGTGYSYAEDNSSFVKNDVEAANDLTTLLMELFNKNEILQKSPLFIVAESYGGKFAATLGLAAVKAIEAGKLKLKLGGNLIYCQITKAKINTQIDYQYICSSLLCRSCLGR